MKTQSKADNLNSDRFQLIKASFSGVLAAFICTIALCVLGGIVQSFLIVNSTLVSNMILIFGYLSSFIGGIIAGRRAKRKGILTGLTTGFLFFLAVLVISLLFVKSELSISSILMRCLIYSVVSMFGGTIGVNSISK